VAELLERAGAGGPPEAVTRRVAAAASSVARCILLAERVREIEINPLFVYADRVVPIDARVILDEG
jgi:succinyl-CoA synthetase beta subunit